MKIAFHGPSTEFTQQILQQLESKLAGDTLVIWQPGAPRLQVSKSCWHSDQ